MPLSRLYDFNSLGLSLSSPIDVLVEVLLLITDSDAEIRSMSLTTEFARLSTDGIGSGNGYIVYNIYNVGKNFEKQILVASFTTYINDIFNNPINAPWIVTSVENIIENKLGKDDILKISFIGIQSGIPKTNIDLGHLLVITNLEPS
jgi:hypothetical protein